MPIFVDTLFIVALVNRRDTYHAQATQLSHILSGQLLLTTDAVLLEIGNALSRHHKLEAIAIIDQFLTSPDIEVIRMDADIFTQAFTLYRNYSDKSWGLIDCLSFAVMRNRNVSDALTFDQHFVQAGFNALMRP